MLVIRYSTNENMAYLIMESSELEKGATMQPIIPICKIIFARVNYLQDFTHFFVKNIVLNDFALFGGQL